jgi:hypothetical protein
MNGAEREPLSYEEIIQELEVCSMSYLPALLIRLNELVYQRGVLVAGGASKIARRVERKARKGGPMTAPELSALRARLEKKVKELDQSAIARMRFHAEIPREGQHLSRASEYCAQATDLRAAARCVAAVIEVREWLDNHADCEDREDDEGDPASASRPNQAMQCLMVLEAALKR